MTNLDSIFKNKNITLLTNVHPVKALVFPVDMYRNKSWTIKKASTEELMLQTVVPDKTLQSPLENREIKPVNLKGN